MESWHRDGLGTITQATTDYKELLANPEVDAVYCAVPHNLHEEFFINIIKAGKHLMGEKPFGIDKKANDNIMKVIGEPGCVCPVLQRVPLYPGYAAAVRDDRRGCLR